MSGLDLLRQQYEKLVNQADGLASLREQAWLVFNKQGLPTTRWENWKYTNIQPLFKRELVLDTPANSLPDLSSLKIEELAIPQSYRLVFVDGQYQPSRSVLPSTEVLEVLSVGSLLTTAEKAQENLVQKIIQALTDETLHHKHPFAALNTVLSTQGVCIHIKKSLENLVEILHVNTAPIADKFTQLQQVIVLADTVQATVVEKFISQGNARSILNSRSDIFLGAHARLRHIRFESQSQETSHFRFMHVNQTHDSHFDSFAFDFGSQFSRADLVTHLNGPHASCDLQGLYIADKKQYVDNHTVIEHNAPECRSRQFYKGIITDSARAVFNGKVIVQKIAQKTDAAQSNKNLLLSKTAEIDTKPELEIYADEVKCAHGSTVGQLDEEAVFYLQSRGLAEVAAKSLLIYAFAQELIMNLPDATLVDYARQRVMEKLPQGEVVREYLYSE